MREDRLLGWQHQKATHAHAETCCRRLCLVLEASLVRRVLGAGSGGGAVSTASSSSSASIASAVIACQRHTQQRSILSAAVWGQPSLKLQPNACTFQAHWQGH